MLLALLAITGCSKKKSVRRAPVAAPIGYAETGIASWYGNPYHGRRAANGETYDMEQMTAAHRTLAFGAIVRVTSQTNGRTVEVRITDRGPFIDDRIIDLSRAAARSIDMIGPGIMKVKLQVIGYGPSGVAPGRYAVQVGAFTDRKRAEKLKAKLEKRFSPVELVAREGNQTQWRVLVGRRASEAEARSLAEALKEETGTAMVVRVDEPRS
jgi:rare lipoprotein A